MPSRRSAIRLALSGLLSLTMAILSLVFHTHPIDPTGVPARLLMAFYWTHDRVVNWAADRMGRWPLQPYTQGLAPYVESFPRLSATLFIVLVSLPVSCLYVWLAAGALARMRRRNPN